MKNIFRFLFVVSCLYNNITNPLFAQWIHTNSSNDGYVYCFVVSGTNLFAGTYNGVFLSTNNGTSWTKVSTGLPVNTLLMTLVYAFVVLDKNLFAATYGGGVCLSTDNGTSWAAVNTGLTNTYVRALAISGTNIFAGTDGGVFLSSNNGTSWTNVSTRLVNANVLALAVLGTNIFAGTAVNGVYRRPLSEMITSVETPSTVLPMHFSLNQNYPNPFNPSTTISFNLPSKSFVSLKVFDALGREVSTILSEELSAGIYSRQWNAASLPSGIYFYRLQAGSFIETKKLVLLK